MVGAGGFGATTFRSVEHARQMIAQCGETNPWIRVSIFGEFPKSSLNALIGPDEVSAAMKRYYRECRHEPCTPLAFPGQGAASSRTACSGLRLVFAELLDCIFGIVEGMSGVQIGPGATAFARMPFSASNCARSAVKFYERD
jgi:hypothetical protein